MSLSEIKVAFPRDEEGYFRRECPYCIKQFKVLVDEHEIQEIEQMGLSSFLLNKQEAEKEDDESTVPEYHCPYCGQVAPEGSWWTQEQLAYLRIFAENMVARIMNESLVRPLQRSSSKSGCASVEIKVHQLEETEPWISPEDNDMDGFDLPCCGKKVKIDSAEITKVTCVYCGFAHPVVK